MINSQLAAALVAFSFSPIIAGIQLQPALSQPRCEPLGRVLDEERSSATKTVLCPGDQVSAGRPRVKFLCYWSGRTLAVVGVNWRPQGCRENTVNLSPCPAGKTFNCVLKGPEDEPGKPILLTPYGNTLSGRRPTFSWAAVSKATHYTVQVYSRSEGWVKQNLKGTALGYPVDQPPLGPGETYQVRVYAYQANQLLGSSTKRLNILSGEEAQELEQLEQEIKALGLPQDEVAYLDLNAVYGGRGLLNEAIAVLEARVQAGSQSPGVYRALAERYLQAGLPSQAQQEYEVAIALAEAEANQQELAKAKAGSQIAAALLRPQN
jgi:hypothetical protein